MLEFAAKAFVTLFVVIEPFGLVPFFLALAGGRPHEEQRRIARKAVSVAGVLILVFALLGRAVLQYMGISLEALKVAGGLLLFRIALDMVFAQHERETEEEEAEARAREDVSVFPMAIPFIAGPGTLASTLILTGAAPGGALGFWLVLLMAALVLVLTYLLLRVSMRLSRVLGRTGINVVTRVLGILLAALAVQYVADGVRVLLKL
ncbi:MAG: MarC family protein [Thermaceae bacterium]|nr:MarC family protein [Thermaceae bacterium]